MQFAHTPITKLRDREAWKVEYFLAPSKVRRDLASPLLPVGELVSERRESLEPSQFPDFLFNYVGLEHVEGLTGDLVSFDPVSGRQIRSRSKIFRAGDVLYGRLRPYLNKVFVAEGSVTTGICSGEFYVLIPRQERIRPCLLRALLASHFVQDLVSRMQAGSTHPRLSVDDLLNVELPVPALSEQEPLERFIHSADAGRCLMKTQLHQAPSRLLRAVEAFVESGTALPDTLAQEVIAPTFENRLPPGFEQSAVQQSF